MSTFLTRARGLLFNRSGCLRVRMMPRKVFEFAVKWDADARVWWCSNDVLPVTAEAPTFDELLDQVEELAPEIAQMNGLAAPGEEIEVHFIAERVDSLPVRVAA